MTRYWVLVFVLVVLELSTSVQSMNVDEGRRRRRGHRIAGPSGSLISEKPIDPSRGRQRQHSHLNRRRIFRDNISEEKINELTRRFKTNVDKLQSVNQLDLIFVIDESSSVGLPNFLDEIRFVSRFVSGIEVDMNHTRVAVVTYADNVTSWTDQVSMGEIHSHKCSLLGNDLPNIVYVGGGTFTKGALERAEIILENAREDSTKVIFLITDGKSNGGEPRDVANRLKRKRVEIFTFGIKEGDREELSDIASLPKEDHLLVLNSFKEFEAVARRALHSDLESGMFIIEDDYHCNKYCTDTKCCHAAADCRCGTTTGKYACVCRPGYYGAGTKQDDGCQACPAGTYKRFALPGDVKTCTPCPDERMTSPEGAISLDQCVCSEGYKKRNASCEPLMCEAVSPPENGRFLACDRGYRSTCIFVCDIGYDLVGTATIACNENEVWTTIDGTQKQKALCQVRHCEALETPDHGTVSCSNDDNSYSTVCSFECVEGYKLSGSSSRTCDANRHWTGADTICKEIRCPSIATPTYGIINGECATSERGRYGDECRFSCPSDGFELIGPETVTCTESGQWEPPIETGRLEICNDTAPPELTCPPDMSVYTATRKAFAFVTWPLPVVSDNSERVVLSPAWTFPVSMRIGEHIMTYTATDDFGLTAQCEFTVTVEDVEPPMIDHCRGPQPIIIEKGETQAENVEWRIPTFTDNSGSLTVNGNASFGSFPIGMTEVKYVATDASGNSRSCMIHVIVQDSTCKPTLRCPRGGHIDCRVISDTTECEMHCDSQRFGFGMMTRSYGNPLYTCDETTEQWDPFPTIPNDCSRQKFSSSILKDIQVTYDMATMTVCNDTEFLDGVRQRFFDILRDEIPKLCVDKVDGHLTCTLTEVEVKCVGLVVERDIEEHHYDDGGSDYYDYEAYSYGEEEAAKRRKRSTRRNHRIRPRPKRQVDGAEQVPLYDDGEDIYDYGGYGEGETLPAETLNQADMIGKPNVNVNFDGDDEEIPVEDISNAIQNAIPGAIPLDIIESTKEEAIKERLEITLTIKGEVAMDGMNYETDRIRHQNMVEIIRNMDLRETFARPVSQFYVESINGTAGDYIVYAEDSYGSTDELICPIGTVLRKKASCVNCPVGSYYHVIRADCVSCPIGYYQDKEAQLSCQACPIDTNTVGIHSRDLSDCLDLCAPGFYSETGVEVCNACQQGYFVDYYGATECAKCPDGNGTIGFAADSPEDCGKLCEPGYVSSTGFAPCQPCPEGSIQEQSGKTFCYVCAENEGEAMDDFVACADIAPGGMTDRLYYNECFSKPCKNNATCTGHGTTFTCKCQPGYTGELCETEIDECAVSPCAETATCIDLINAFRCECAPGYAGILCEDEINECASEPCQNGASCVDRVNSFSCDCDNGYEGFLCEIDIDDCAENPCQNNGTCVDEVAGFHCDCTTGFEGVICETNTDDCAGQPCLNHAACIDGINTFRCDCKPGFNGPLCSVNIDECASNPCVNGDCLDLVNSYKCLCPPTYLGEHCENVGDPDFDLYFGRPNTYHHVKLEYALPNMTEVTVSFYLKSNTTETYGTPFSYAVGDGKNADALTLTDLSALTLYVNGNFVVSDSKPINDGQWYLVTVVWTSEEGRWYIYLNGVLEDRGEGLATGQAIPGGGTLVIGQEQDTLGGGFSSSQEFLGTISQFNVHDYAFTANQVLLLWRNCADHVGNIRAWPEMGGGIIGTIEKKPTEFCLPCPTITSDNGTVVTIETNYSISLQCNEGYELLYDGVKRRLKTFQFRCGSDGVWKFRGKDVNASQLRCERISCPDLEEIALGFITLTGSKYGDTATYSCNVGYQVVGSGMRTCEANKTWSQREPTCEDVDECLSDEACDHHANCTNQIGSYTCACVFGWKGTGHTCREIDCGGAGSLQFGSISGNNFKLNGVVHYSCDYGYRLEGPAERTCLFDDSWSGEMPVCVKVECPEPEDVRHSSKHPLVATRSYKSEITYTCHPGYFMVGNATRECGPDSRWTGELPSCERVSCGDPPIVANAITIKDGGIKYGDIVHYVCEQEYRPLGDSELVCNASRHWEAPKKKNPVCEHPTCNVPPSIINGQYRIKEVGESTITDAVYTYDTQVEYICNVGYNIVGQSVLTCKEREAWDASVPRCDIVSCGPPPLVDNAQQESNGVLYSDLAYYMCLPGYFMIGEDTLTCLASGKWTDDSQVNPTCNPRPCGAPQDVPHAQQTLSEADDYVYKAVINFRCDLGYWSYGEKTIFCNEGGHWVPEQNFRCDIAVCAEPRQPRHGKFTRLQPAEGDRYEYNNSVVYSCDEGFQFGERNTSRVSRCGEYGQWTLLPPRCWPVECDLPSTVENSTFEIENGPYGRGPIFESTITYSCDVGYKHSGGQIGRGCKADGTWTGEAPTCTRVECGVAPTVQFATPILILFDSESDGDSLLYLDGVEYLCDVGFYLSGNGVIQCTAEKTFTESPTCEPISCGEPPAVTYSNMRQEHVYGENVFQSTTTYTCEADFEMVGNPLSICGSNGHWDTTDLAECIPITCGEPDLVENAVQFVSASEEDVAYPEIYKAGQYQPRSSSITACVKGHEIVEEVAKLRSADVEIASDEDLARTITTNAIEQLSDESQVRIRKVLSKLLDEEPELISQTYKSARTASTFEPKTFFVRQCDEAVGWLKTSPKCQPMKCPVPYRLQNGHLVNGTDAEEIPLFGAEIRYACDEGYKFAGADSINDIRISECAWSDTLWNVYLTEVPACLPLPCPDPPAISDGFFSDPEGETFVFQDVARYYCEEGYEMTAGSETLRCESSQTWSGEVPTCSRVKCPNPIKPENGRFTGRTYAYESVVSYRCDRGYNLNGKANLTCRSDRTWSAEFPVCDPVPCGTPPDVENSNVLTTSEVYGGCAIYTCKHGFYLNGYAKVQCTAAGAWERNLPICKFMLCPKPPVTSHVVFVDSVLSELFAERDSNNYIYDDVVTYSCEEGYETNDVDDLSATCLTGENIPNIPICDDNYYIEDIVDGFWSRPPPDCTAKDCGAPPAPHRNGIVVGTDTTFNQTVHYVCHNGYYTNDESPTATCLSNAAWSRTESPQCLPVPCGEPNAPRNGYFVGTAFTYKQLVNFGCNEGHDLLGSATIRCQANGTWSDPSPVCEPKDCGQLPLIHNGKLAFEDTVFGEEAVYSCDSGYYMRGRSLFECTALGSWSHPIPPQCLPVDCGALSNPKNGIVNATGHVFMNRAVFSCFPGYYLDGAEEIECLASASWSNDSPTCEPVDCGDPPPLDNARMIVNGSTTFLSSQKYTCDSGYEMIGSSGVTCQADITWSEPPVCTRVKCLSPGRPQFGLISKGAKLEYLYEDVVEYSCNQGYFAVGETVTTCTADRSWSNSLPHCQPVNCGDLPYIVHGRNSTFSSTFMTVVTYSCWSGFYVAGNSSLECLHTGDWSSEAPTCERISCGRPPHLKHGNITGGGSPEEWVYETHIVFSCQTGYHLHGGAGAKCTENGTWVYDYNFHDDDVETYDDRLGVPTCVLIRCDDPPTTEHGSYIEKEYTYDTTVGYTCDEGYEKEQNEDVICSGNSSSSLGYYVGEPPVCKPVSCGPPRQMENGYVSADGFLYQSLAVYSCDAGYNLIGDPVAECLPNKRWSSRPSCLAKNCGLPEIPEFSNMTITSTLFPSVLTIKCQNGYDLQGRDEMACTAEGVWSNQEMSQCTPVVCGNPEPIEHGLFFFSGIVFQSQATYQCSAGYNLIPQVVEPLDATVTIRCQADGSWQEGIPRCDPVVCGVPPTTENGYRDIEESVVFPQSVEYGCNYGYSFGWFATTTLYCTETGVFSTSAPRCYPVSCGAPPSRNNGLVEAEAYTYGHVATYTCKYGYVLETEEFPSETYRSGCTGEGIWEPLPPAEGCIPYNCGPPLILPNAEVPAFTTNTTFGSLYTYQCIDGHEAPDDTLTVNCERYGIWSSGPDCQPVDCGERQCPTKAECTTPATIYNNTFTAQCEEGYEFQPGISSYTLTCTADATWSETDLDHPQECVRLSCGAPPVVVNAHTLSEALAGDEHLFGSRVQYICDPGHDLRGLDSVECQADGSWGPNSLPTCVLKDCGEPPPCIDKANCTFVTTTFKSYFTISCNEGYEIERDIPVGNLRCTEAGEWEKPEDDLFACLALECQALPTIKHGRALFESDGRNPTYQDKVGYACDEGYIVEGIREVKCQSDRTYTEVPECSPVPCGEPFQLDNGVVESTGNTFQHQATYQCNPGYFMEGAQNWICSADGSWAADAGNEKAAPVVMGRSVAPSGYTTHDLQVMFSEASGESEISGSGEHSESMMMSPAAVSNAPPICRPVPCGVPPTVTNEIEAFTSPLVFNESVTYRCKPGFEMIGVSVLRCLENGGFGPNPPPTCVRVRCPMPEATDNCEVVGSTPFKFEDTVIYRPLKGYEFSGNALTSSITITCTETREVDISELPPCVPVSCGMPQTPLNGRFLAEAFTYQQTADYSCDLGYDLVGPSSLTCLSTREWSSDAPQCKPVSCGTPPFLTLGSMKLATGDIDPFTYGQTVEYTCDLGYMFNSDDAGDGFSIRCQHNRIWDLTPPECIPVPCPNLQVIDNGFFNLSGESVFRSRALFKCDIGHEMQGEPLLICQADGTWSNDPPICHPVSCDFPPRVPYSIQDSSRRLSYGQSITYECIPGYELFGGRTLTCTEDGIFDYDSPICMPVECERPPELEFGYFVTNAGGFLFMSSITYRCSLGYRMISEDEDRDFKSVSCEANKKWSDGPPKCEIISCDMPEGIENGYVDFTATTYQSMIAHSCEAGYEINKNSSHFEHCLESSVCMVCQANGIWGFGNSEFRPAKPVCSPVLCGELPAIEHGSFVSESLFFKGSASYSCDKGYEFPDTDSVHLECQSNAEWGPLPVPNCQRVKCSTPIQIDHGQLHVLQRFAAREYFVFGDTITYSCNDGYEATAFDNITCGFNKIWDAEPPICNPVNCGPPPARKHGHLSESSDIKTTFGSVVKYGCDDGYEDNGEESGRKLICNANRLWSASAPSPCTAVDCGLPVGISHGSYVLQSGESTTFRSEVEYVCDIGHEISGDSSLSCHSDKIWKPSVPSCNPVSCSVPPKIEHGAPDVEFEPVAEKDRFDDPGAPEKRAASLVSRFVYQNTVNYFCDIGYTIESGSRYARCNENGSWVDLPTCTLVTCDALPPGDNSVRVGEVMDYASVVSYVCNSGFKHADNRTMVECICGQQGRFYPNLELYEEEVCLDKLPECSRISCGPPPVVENSILNSHNEEYLYEDEVAFVCMEGYEMNGEAVLRCNANGRYSKAPPKCSRVSCGLPQPVENAATLVDGMGMKYGDIVRYECHPGYVMMTESRQRVCQSDREWSNECVRCDPINCTEIAAPTFGSILNPISVSFGSNVIFGCDEGYDLVGNQFLTCDAAGNWSSSVPECIPILCDPLPIVEYGIPLSQVIIHRFGSAVEFMCLPGYEILGSLTINCLANGRWTPPPECPPVECLDIPEFPDAFVTNARVEPFTYGQIVQYECHGGYHLKSAQTSLTCEEEGTFSSHSIICERIPCPPAPIIEHGIPSSAEGFYGDRITYTCDIGYEIFGSDAIVCNILGSWMGPIPTCDPVSCGPAPLLLHGYSPEIEEYFYQDIVYYECEEGYEFSNDNVATCQADGTYLMENVQCSLVTCDLIPTESNQADAQDGSGAEETPSPPHTFWTVFYKEKSLTYLSEAILTCDPGFILESGKEEERFICQANKTWSGDFSVVNCVPIECPNLPVLANGEIEVTYSPESVVGQNSGKLLDNIVAHVFGARANFRCHEGYVLQGSSTATCDEEGRWSSISPTCAPVTCGVAPSVENAVPIESVFTYGMAVEYQCVEGYYIDSEARHRTCRSDGTFSEEHVSCEPILCPEVPSTEHGIPKLNVSRVGDENFYICEPGYESYSVIRCLPTGEWSGGLDQCTPVECELAPAVWKAKLVENKDFVYGDTAWYTCVEGHLLSNGFNSLEIACDVDGSFHQPESGCLPVECDLDYHFENAMLVFKSDKAVFGDIAYLACTEGYESTGSQEVICSATGDWSFDDAGCLMVQCGVAPKIEDAIPALAQDHVYSYNERVRYTCREGTELRDPESVVTCQSDGTFTDPGQEFCIPTKCPLSSVFDHGFLSAEVAYYGEKLLVTCDIGYEVQGFRTEEITLHCQAAGEWSEDINSIFCVPIECDMLEPLENGEIFLLEPDSQPTTVNSSLFFGSVIFYQCNTGYTLKGVARQNCLTDGSWSGTLPVCVPVECGPPPFILHGNFTGSGEYSFGHEISYECNKGYKLDPSESVRRVCNELGLWTGQHPSCTPINCGPPPPVNNGVIESIRFTYNSEIFISCNEGSTMLGSRSRTCRADGTWSGVDTECQRIVCGFHPIVEHGFVDPSTAKFSGEEVEITCNEGFELFGDSIRVCENVGEWGGVAPSCVKSEPETVKKFDVLAPMILAPPCPPPAINGTKIKLVKEAELKESYQEGETLEYCCSPGYIPIGDMTIHCKRGSWTGKPSCISQCRHKCRNRGRCSGKNRCTCSHGWKGSRCHKPVCTQPCLNGGFCSGPFLCSCKSGWTGTRCETPVCSKPCQNGGKCESPDFCYCPYGYGGTDCSEKPMFSLW